MERVANLGTRIGRADGCHDKRFLIFADRRRWNYAETWGPNGKDPHDIPGLWHRGIRDERYKIVRDMDEVEDLFFDLAVDPEEDLNLLAEPLSPELRRIYYTLAQHLDSF